MEAFKPVGIGANAAKNVLKWVFSQALSAPPKLKAWDNFLMTTVLHQIFAGTEGNGNKPMMGAIGCSVAPDADWFPASKVAGAAVDNASLLMGNTGFIKLSATAPGAEGEVFANFNYKFPSDAEPASAWAAILALEYEYTGTPPQIAAYGNKGTEASPSWQALIMGLKGYAPQPGTVELKPCNGGEGPDGTGNYFFTRPESGEAHPEEIWAKEYEE